MSKVIIAEKPSVARNIADALKIKTRRDGFLEGPDYIITWAYGHLLELYDAKDYDSDMASWKMDNFPFIPDTFKYKSKEDALKQLEVIRTLISRADVDGIISACDYDREGQIIGDITIEHTNSGKPVERLLLNEWTPDEVLNGMSKLISNEKMTPLRDAGVSRQWADWLIGINLTSVATLKYQRGFGKALNVGRVLLPTLKIIYDRDLEIENFKSDAYYRMLGQFKSTEGETYDGIYTTEEGDKFEDVTALKTLKESFTGAKAIVSDQAVENKREYPPSLFNLSGLQGYVTSKNKGWTSDKVLKVAQSLYEKKLITYPRTASLALEDTLKEKTQKVLAIHQKGLPYAHEIQFHTQKRVFDNTKVESHSAIIPTYLIGKGLSNDEKVVYEAVKNRFIMQFMPIAEHDEVTVKTLVKDSKFITKGRIQRIEGWRQVEKIKSKEVLLPNLVKGDSVTPIGFKIDKKTTNPPKRHTEKTLLRVMETCGRNYKPTDDSTGEMDSEMIESILSGFSIGTPATRAETITKLKRVGYIEAKGKSLTCTEMGRKMVELFPVQSLFDLEYTGRLEKSLSDIGKNTISKDDFMKTITDFTKDAVYAIKEDAFHVIQDLEQNKKQTRESLGKCPVCGSDVVEGEKGFGCSNWKSGCKFVVWKNDRYLEALKVTPNKNTVKKLLETGEVFSNQFTNKKGEKFSAFLTYKKNTNNDYFSWEMSFSSKIK
ncbi:type IA DNA topoisomerase [Fusibacter tunisiensis]|uniref:DNA topoisomerase n=1 Tax=Fusibacter tunisiensis TaxID=1008308 RepID=A0ABS2MP02_9FIRM|nr:type IA DNA topoisomerase [Fusibacter tunisiensis]MBM7561131.1 DNA topoisomerase-3 [Fusibacter tunisiensis]